MSNFGRPPPDSDSMVSLKVDNLSFRTKPEDLLEEFQRFGEVGDIYIPRDRETKESRGFAFIRYYSRRDAELAMEKMDGEIFDDRELRVQKAKYGRPSRPPPYRGRYDDRARYDYGRGGYDRGYPSRSRRSRSPRRRRRSFSRSPRRNSPSRSRSRSPRRSPPRDRSRSRTRSRSQSPVRSRTPERSRSREQDNY